MQYKVRALNSSPMMLSGHVSSSFKHGSGNAGRRRQRSKELPRPKETQNNGLILRFATTSLPTSIYPGVEVHGQADHASRHMLGETLQQHVDVISQSYRPLAGI